ncbi:MAG: hypothetical protein U9N45_04060 [Gemmatimonadota bacterium]|nr:hypothetical protein [Gemmatimonadota bacterium]
MAQTVIIIDRYTKSILTVIAICLFIILAAVVRNGLERQGVSIPAQCYATEGAATLVGTNSFITTNSDGDRVYFWLVTPERDIKLVDSAAAR